MDENKIFKHDEQCYKYKQHSTTCMPNKKTVAIDSKDPDPNDPNTLTKTPMSFFDKK